MMINCTIINNTALLTINRPESLNALNKELIKELIQHFTDLINNDQIKVIILTGTGKAFVAGADIKAFVELNANEAQELALSNQQQLFSLMAFSSKPIIAAINGYALGGGLELALASHIRIASSEAQMGLPEVKLGLIPGYGGTQRLAQVIGKGRAMEMIITAEMISAEKALNYGLITAIHSTQDLINEAHIIANQLIKNSPNGIKTAIQSIENGYIQDGFTTEASYFGECFNHPDAKEGIAAFIEKRKPNFK